MSARKRQMRSDIAAKNNYLSCPILSIENYKMKREKDLQMGMECVEEEQPVLVHQKLSRTQCSQVKRDKLSLTLQLRVQQV